MKYNYNPKIQKSKDQSKLRIWLWAFCAIGVLFVLSACSANQSNDKSSSQAADAQSSAASDTKTDAQSQNAVPKIPLASGEQLPQVKTASLLKVETDKNHEPTVTILDKAKKFAPGEQLTDVIIKGTGPVIQDGDIVTVQYMGIKYSTGAVFDSSFRRGGQPLTFSLENVISGFKQMLIGQNVGSRIVSAFDSSLGYGADTDPPSPTKGDMIFVVDIIERSQKH